MTKMKTRKIISKRFKLTKNGKIMHRTQGRQHLRSRKNKKRQRRQDAPREITNTKYKRMIKSLIET